MCIQVVSKRSLNVTITNRFWVVVQLVYWQLSWLHRYYMSSQPYTYSDAVYLTRTSLGLVGGQWISIGTNSISLLVLGRAYRAA